MGLCEVSIWHHLLFIAKHNRSKAIRQICSSTYGLFLWGYPLSASLEIDSDMDQRGAEFTASMIAGLEARDMKQCVAAVQAYIQKQIPAGKEYLIRNGIEAEEPRFSPSIRMLLLNE